MLYEVITDLQTAPHGACGDRVADHVVVVDVDLAAHVALDTGDRIDHHALTRITSYNVCYTKLLRFQEKSEFIFYCINTNS